MFIDGIVFFFFVWMMFDDLRLELPEKNASKPGRIIPLIPDHGAMKVSARRLEAAWIFLGQKF